MFDPHVWSFQLLPLYTLLLIFTKRVNSNCLSSLGSIRSHSKLENNENVKEKRYKINKKRERKEVERGAFSSTHERSYHISNESREHKKGTR